MAMKDKTSLGELRSRLGTETIGEAMPRDWLTRCGHVETTEENNWVQKYRSVAAKGRRGRGID